MNGAGVPKNPFRLALLVQDYEDELYLASPPLFVQRAIFGPLAFMGRLLGYTGPSTPTRVPRGGRAP